MTETMIMTKTTSVFLYVCALFVVCIIPFLLIWSNAEQEKRISGILGKNIVINKDTFQVINHNNLHKTFLLSNGTEINEDLAFKHILNE